MSKVWRSNVNMVTIVDNTVFYNFFKKGSHFHWKAFPYFLQTEWDFFLGSCLFPSLRNSAQKDCFNLSSTQGSYMNMGILLNLSMLIYKMEVIILNNSQCLAYIQYSMYVYLYCHWYFITFLSEIMMNSSLLNVIIRTCKFKADIIF